MACVRISILLSFLFFAPILDAAAQEYRAPSASTSGVPYFRYVNLGEPSILIMVVGSATSGMYEIGMETDLAELLVLTGGASIASNSSQSKTTVSVRLYRGNDQQRSVIYEASMEELLTEPARSPALQEGDIFQVDARVRNRFTWRDIATTISILASLTIIAGRVLNQF